MRNLISENIFWVILSAVKKNKHRFVLTLLILGNTLVFYSCTDAKKVQENDPVHLGKSTEDFKNIVASMKDPKGLINCSIKNLITVNSSMLVIKKSQTSTTSCDDRTDFYDYFIFDRTETLFILQTNPLVYFYINSPDLNFHLSNELNQFLVNPSLGATEKIKNSQTAYVQVGRYEIAIAFTPNELVYSGVGANKGRIQDRNSATFLDFWRLLDASKDALIYIPGNFKEARLFTDIYCQVQKGNNRIVYTPSSSLTLTDLPDWFRTPGDDRFDQACIDAQRNDRSTIRPWYETKPTLATSVKFFNAFGRNLVLNDALLGAIQIEFADRLGLTRPFAFFVSTPLGNTENQDDSEDLINQRHGFSIQVRGNIDSLLAQANTLGLPSFTTPFNPAKVLNSINQGSVIKVNWAQTANVQVLHYATSSKLTLAQVEALPDSSFLSVANVTGENEVSLSIAAAIPNCMAGAITPGCTHWFKVVGVETTPSVTPVVIGREPVSGEVLFTEIMWAGSQTLTGSSGTDEWFEIKNISTDIINLSQLDFYNGGNTQADIVLGPNYNASATTAGHEAIIGILYPGEYAIIARKLDVFFSNFSNVKIFSRKTGGLTNGGGTFYIGKGLKVDKTLSLTTSIVQDSFTIDSITYNGTIGASGTPVKSMVRIGNVTVTPEIPGDGGADWATSTTDSNEPISGYNFATPGTADVFATTPEY